MPTLTLLNTMNSDTPAFLSPSTNIAFFVLEVTNHAPNAYNLLTSNMQPQKHV
jgi:hypothetical protein